MHKMYFGSKSNWMLSYYVLLSPEYPQNYFVHSVRTTSTAHTHYALYIPRFCCRRLERVGAITTGKRAME